MTTFKEVFPNWSGRRDADKGRDADPPKPDIIDRVTGATERVEKAASDYTKSYNTRDAENKSERAETRERENNESLKSIAESLRRRDD
jgi:hypothetical protein